MMRKILLLSAFTLLAALAVLSALRDAPTQAQSRREIEGATVEDTKITLKPGFEFVSHPNNGVSVRKKNEKTKEPPPPSASLTCVCTRKANCEGDGACAVKFTDTDAKCESRDCCSCKFK